MSIGSQLRQARERRSLGLDDIAQATHIKVHYLEALEADRFDVLPSAAQLRGFLRAYADFLTLDSNELLKALDSDSMGVTDVPATLPALSEVPQVVTNSAAIFKELGHTLQSQRELMGLSLGDVERHTHIRMHYIRALEDGDIAHLPSPVQGRGMLSNYASFLGLNTETVLLRFADGLQAGLYDRQTSLAGSPTQPRNKETAQVPTRPSQFKRLFSMDLFVGGFFILFLLGFTVWGALRISKLHSSQAPSPTAPSVSDILLTTPTGSLAGTSSLLPATVISTEGTALAETPLVTGTIQALSSAAPNLVASTPGLANAPVQVDVVAVQRAWMRMTVDGNITFEGRVIPGGAYSFAAQDRIELLTGDGAGIQVYFNQQNLGLLGGFGEIIERIFTIAGVQTTTPSVPPTGTPVPTSQATPSATPTGTGVPASPTATPKVTPTPPSTP